MNWNLPVQIKTKESFKPITYADKVMLWGSCFSESIGSKLFNYKFQSVNNPNGILYNPKSISMAFKRAYYGDRFLESDLTLFNDLWLSLMHHTSFSNESREGVLKNINSKLIQSNEFMSDVHTIIVTFGTSYYYRQKETNKIVGNCHKIPANQFNREQLSISTIVEDYSELIQLIKSTNLKAQWIFTVSPIRHWKDGAVDNNLSKSKLICAVHELVKAHQNVHYFPSYEIMMDELRDYRFYSEDMIHPSEQAIDYIWSQFLNTCFNLESIQLSKEIGSIKKACQHKPFNFESTKHQEFVAKIESKISILSKTNSFLDFSSELLQLRKKAADLE